MTREEIILDRAKDYGDGPEHYRRSQPIWIAAAVIIFVIGCIVGGTIMVMNLINAIQRIIEKL